MSELLLIRHGQASFGAEDYDVLSDTGAAQARALGRHLAESGLELDALYAGPRVRHRDTARHLLEGARAAGGALPEDPTELAELDEYPAFALLRRWLPVLQRDEPELAAAAAGAPAQSLDRALERIVHRWARGELDSGDLESYDAFCDRVCRGLERVIADEGRGVRVALVTSGGPISIAVRRALELSPEKAMKVAWVLANTSLTEIRYRDARELGLIRLNAIPHLVDRRLITYR